MRAGTGWHGCWRCVEAHSSSRRAAMCGAVKTTISVCNGCNLVPFRNIKATAALGLVCVATLELKAQQNSPEVQEPMVRRQNRSSYP